MGPAIPGAPQQRPWKFDGHLRREYQYWLDVIVQHLQYLDVPDEDQVFWLMQYLEGEALNWARRFVRQQDVCFIDFQYQFRWSYLFTVFKQEVDELQEID